MASKATRQEALRGVAATRERLHAERRARDQRIERAALAVRVEVAARREAAVRAGQAIELMFAEGLTRREVATWCGGVVDATEISRLRALVKQPDAERGVPETSDVAATT